MLVNGDPVGSAALEEFNRRDLVGSFASWPSNGDTEELMAAAARDHYIAAEVALLNASPDIEQPPKVSRGLYLFEPKPISEGFKTAFVNTYAGHVGLLQVAHERVRADMDSEKVSQMSAAERVLFDELVVSLAGEGRRLIGGFVLLASIEAPKKYVGFVFGVLALLERYQIEAREASLKGVLDQSEELRRRRLTMQPDSEVESLAHSAIVRKLLSKDKVAESLGVKAPPIENLLG